MALSKQHAQEVALTALGLSKPMSDGAGPLAVEVSPAADFLQPKDRILAVDGERATSTCAVGNVIGGRDSGDEVRVTVLRKAERRAFL